MIEDGYTYLQISCVLAFSTQIEDTWPFLKIMRRNNPNSLPHNELITDRSGNPYQYFHYTAWGESFAQAIYCLNANDLEIDLLINFGSKRLGFK